ncbi:AEC family transporter [Oleisolibacter albus]|uniref:AEC family transporter n=1 Tax=Oleisolibacter albus TaxID=2171757 RepID=UPI000DF246E8|nr:AEC family transporter [Oleisolibacter albus]
MSAVATALAPIFLLIVLGWTLRRRQTVPDSFWAPAETLTYYILFPALLVDSTARADLAGLDIAGLCGALIPATLLATGLLLLLHRRLGRNGPAFTSVYQGAIRVNSYVGLAASSALFGREGTAVMAIGVIAIVPLVNVLSVLVLDRWGSAAGRGDWRRTLRGLAGNPLIVGVLVGAGMNAAGLHSLPVLSPLLSILGAASLPLGLLAVGAGLDFGAARGAGRDVLAASVIRLGLVPGLTALLGGWLGLAALPLAVAVLYNGLPTSASSYVLARLMGGDHRLMAGIITVQTLAAAATLPVWLWLLER